MDLAVLIVIVAVALAVALFLGATIKVIRQQQIGVVERLGKFHRLLEPGPHLVVPVFDRVRYNLDMREAVVPFPPQGVITEDNLMVSIDSVIYFQIIDPVRAAYEAQDYIKAIEQLTQTTLRNIIGGLDLEQTLRGFGCAVLGPVATGGEALDLDRFTAHLVGSHLPHLVIVDCSASAAVIPPPALAPPMATRVGSTVGSCASQLSAA